jgi:predicted dehydrogenase
MDSQIKWGIIGCGDVTEVKSGPAFNKIKNSNLAAVMRRDAEKAADYASRHGVGKWYTDADELMNDADINAVYIATPPAFHLPYTVAALQKGLNVYVEKPVTLNASEARQIAAAVSQSGAKLTVAHYRRRLPLFLKIKSLIDSGIVGGIRTVQIRLWQSRDTALVAKTTDNWRVKPEFSGGGYFHDLAPHQLDLMLFYFGEPLSYAGYSMNQAGHSTADDHVSGQILFENNIMVTGSWCFNVAGHLQTDTCEIIGSEGAIVFSFFGSHVIVIAKDGVKTETFVHPQHVEQPMIADVVAYFNDEAPNPCAIDEAIVLMDIMDAFTGKNNINTFR